MPGTAPSVPAILSLRPWQPRRDGPGRARNQRSPQRWGSTACVASRSKPSRIFRPRLSPSSLPDFGMPVIPAIQLKTTANIKIHFQRKFLDMIPPFANNDLRAQHHSRSATGNSRTACLPEHSPRRSRQIWANGTFAKEEGLAPGESERSRAAAEPAS